MDARAEEKVTQMGFKTARNGAWVRATSQNCCRIQVFCSSGRFHHKVTRLLQKISYHLSRLVTRTKECIVVESVVVWKLVTRNESEN